MIQTNACQHARNGMLDQIGCIQPAAKSRLQNQIFHSCIPKNQKASRKKQLKIGRMGKTILNHIVYFCFDLLKRPRKTVLRYRTSIDLKPFRNLHQVWRCKQACAFSGFSQNRGKKRTDRAFSVRPRHMNYFHTALRMANPPEQLKRIFWFVFFRKLWHFFYIIRRFCIIHPVHPLLFFLSPQKHTCSCSLNLSLYDTTGTLLFKKFFSQNAALFPISIEF